LTTQSSRASKGAAKGSSASGAATKAGLAGSTSSKASKSTKTARATAAAPAPAPVKARIIPAQTAEQSSSFFSNEKKDGSDRVAQAAKMTEASKSNADAGVAESMDVVSEQP
jgi:hypothetical protein